MEDFNPDDEPKNLSGGEEETGDLVGQNEIKYTLSCHFQLFVLTPAIHSLIFPSTFSFYLFFNHVS